MRKALAVLVSMSAVIFGFAIGAAAAGSADTSYSVMLKIPFAFYAGDTQFPAGNYWIEMPAPLGAATGTLLRVSSRDGANCLNMFTMRVDGVSNDTDYHVTFNKYGDAYFLSKVRNSDLGAQLTRSRSEKKVASEYSRTSGAVASVEVVAAPSRAK
jgi:hypothetical protein